MLELEFAEFYITNVCNLNCPNCNRFNNFAFTGHQIWADYKDVYSEWAKKINIKRIGILGGEPLLNPDLINWILGLFELWPECKICITSNGTMLKQREDLYRLLQENPHRLILEISTHGPTMKPAIFENIKNFLKGPISKGYSVKKFRDQGWTRFWWVRSNDQKIWNSNWHNIKADFWPDCNTVDDFEFLPDYIKDECLTKFDLGLTVWEDTNSVRVLVSPNDNFYPGAIIHDVATNQLTLHNSNPKKAIKVCKSKFCHHFSYGKLYKCGTVGILPEFISKFKVNISQEDQNLINSYVPAEYSWSNEQLNLFLQSLKNGDVIDHCKFCTERLDPTPIDSGVKKPKVIRITSEFH